MEIYPSLMCADLLNLEKVISELEPHCDGFHIDVMDDHFVPNLTMGPDFVNAIAKITKKPLHVHLMVGNPCCWPERLHLNNQDTIFFHYELFENNRPVKALIEKIKKYGYKAGLALNPHTDWLMAKPILESLDKILIMSVKPGFAGQTFIPDVLEKPKKLVEYKKLQHETFEICMDGGIGKDNIKNLAELGIDAVAVGASIFAQKNPVKALKELYEILNHA